MDIITTSLEALIQRATNVTNQGPDTAAIDAFCGLVNKEPESAHIAVKFISAKVHSLQEWEALQALHVLEMCMKRCGSVFHSEVGKFRFLNELIKLVSPKYLGAHTPEAVRRRVLELMYSWTFQFPKEVKIKEAYDMLKKQGVVKEEPQLASREKQCKEQPSILQDEEKSQLLQKLLQSKNPDDLQAANRLIKSMVKEDERRVEEKWKNAADLETAINNCRLLREMLDNWDPVGSSKEDLDLIKELHAACLSLSPTLHKLAASSDPAFCQSVIAANMELGSVFVKYNLLMKSPGDNTSDNVSSLLDLTPNSPMVVNNAVNNDLTDIELNLPRKNEASVSLTNDDQSPVPNQTNLLDEIFGGSPPLMSSVPPMDRFNICPLPIEKERKPKGLEDLDILGKSLLQESLSSIVKNAPTKPVKISLNDMCLLSAESSKIKNSSNDDVSILMVSDPETSSSTKDEPLLISDDSPLPVEEPKVESVAIIFDTKSNERSKPETQVLPLGDIKVTLDIVKPSNIPPFLALEEKNGITVAIFLSKNSPRSDVSVFVITTSSKNESPLENFLFQPVVPKCCRLRLLPSSSNTLPAHNPFLPPSAITQIMLIASPNKIPITLKFVVSYSLDEETCTEFGEIKELPLVEN